jgi:hypothetical protein
VEMDAGLPTRGSVFMIGIKKSDRSRPSNKKILRYFGGGGRLGAARCSDAASRRQRQNREKPALGAAQESVLVSRIKTRTHTGGRRGSEGRMERIT